MFSTLSKFLLISFLYLMLMTGAIYSQGRNVTTIGTAYNHTFNFDLEIQRVTDNKFFILSDSFNGASFIYEPVLDQNLNYAFALGMLNRYSKNKLFSSDARGTDITEQIMWGQAGISILLKKVWLFIPYAGISATYFSVSSKIQNTVINSEALKKTLDGQSTDKPYIDESISTSIFQLNVTLGLHYRFQYSGIKLYLQAFPHYFNKGDKLNKYYNYKYNLSGYLLGIGFTVFL